MNDKVLLKQFNTDPGVAFIDVIRLASSAIDAKKVKDRIKAVGAKASDVDAKWSKLQKHVNAHPHIRKPTSRLYEWGIEPTPSHEALKRLSGNTPKSVPTWLTEALVNTVADSLAAAETSGPGAQWSWSDQRELEKAQVFAALASQLELRLSKGQTAAEVLTWIQDQASSRRLEPLAHIGQQVPYDPELHDGGEGQVRGADVVVVSCGYRWIAGTAPTVVARALVRAV